MDIQKKSRRTSHKLSGGRNQNDYPHGLQFYSLPPMDNISLSEFETFAVERLKVLKAVETVGIRKVKSSPEYDEELVKELNRLKKQGGMKFIRKFYAINEMTDEEYDERRRDHISHFILRLAYCRSDELRRWFVNQELDLFRYRFCRESTQSIKDFLELNNLKYEPISQEEKEVLHKKIQSAAGYWDTDVDTKEFFKVPFTEALDLIKNRRVILSKGFAYVPHNDLVVLILAAFRTHLSKALAMTARAVPHLEEDGRLLPLLCGLSKRYLGDDYGNKKVTAGQVTAAMLETLSKKSFPLCMQQLHQNVRQHHHLRHGGRQQYGLFLKGIGMSLEESLKFWRQEFSKLMDGDKFDKQYAYNIRHNYGKEGKRADYTPYSCVKIIMANMPGPGDFHGCPFKHSDVDLLRQRMQGLGIGKDKLDGICDAMKRGAPQIACASFFEAQHPSDIRDYSVSINHPNQYFEESQKYHNGETNTSSSGTPSSQKVARKVIKVPISQSSSQSNSQDSSLMDSFDDEPFSMEDVDSLMQEASTN